MNELYSLLIVEDEPLSKDAIYSIVREKLADKFNLIMTADNGIEAMEMFKAIPFNIVLTDISMPQMDGLTLAEQLDSLFPDTVKIILTGYDEFQYARSSIRYHVLEYLLKPIEEDELVKTLKKALMLVSEKREMKKNAGYVNLHYSGKMSILYTTTIINSIIISIRSKNKENLKKAISDLSYYMETELDNHDEQRNMAIWILETVLSCAPDLASNTTVSYYSSAIRQSQSKTKIRELLEECFVNCSDQIVERNRRQRRLYEIKEFIAANYSKDISLQMLSEKFNLNPTYISELFKSFSDQSFSEYLLEIRINHAVDYLEKTDLKINQIAEKVGYADANYFIKAFKKIVGMSPNRFRTNLR